MNEKFSDMPDMSENVSENSAPSFKPRNTSNRRSGASRPISTSTRTINPKTWSTSKTIIVIALAIVLMAGAVGMTYLNANSATSIPSPFVGMPVTEMKGQFVDVNGDGKLDFVVSAQVIINPGDVNFIQPTQQVPVK